MGASDETRDGMVALGLEAGLTLSLPPDLATRIREGAAQLGETPRLLALDVLAAVFAPGQACLLGAVLDR